MNIKYDYRTKNDEVVDKCFLNCIEFLRITLPGGLRIEVDSDDGEPTIGIYQDTTYSSKRIEFNATHYNDEVERLNEKLDHVAKFAQIMLDHGEDVMEAGLSGIISFCEKKALGA